MKLGDEVKTRAKILRQGLVAATLAASAFGCSPGFVSMKHTASSRSNTMTDELRAKGLEAFQATAYNHVRTNCASCHTNVQKPFFASTTVVEAFDEIQSRIDWDNLEGSKIVAQAGNGHCQVAACQGQSAPLLEALKAWKALWDDKGAGPTLEWSVTTINFSEGDGTAGVTLRSSFPAPSDLQIAYGVGGTASNPRDHSLRVQGVVSLPAGQSQARLDLGLIDNAIDEGSRTIVIQIQDGDGYALGTNSTVTVTLTDNDPTPVVQFASASQSVTESAGMVQIQILSSGPSVQDILVPYTVAGTAGASDHNLITGTARIPAGSTSTLVSFSVTDDAVSEAAETVVLSLGTPSGALLGALNQHTVTINDNDSPPVVQFKMAAQTADEGTTATIAVELTAASALTVTVPFTVSGSASSADHGLVSGTLTFTPGTVIQNLNVTVASDAVIENDETLIVTLGNPMGAASGTPMVHTLTIKDKTPPPTVQFAATSQKVSETAGQAGVTVSLSTASTVAVTVPFTVSGSAQSGTDFNLAATAITIPAGQTMQSVTVSILSDAVFENDETVILTMGTPTNATAGTNRVHTLTITEGAAPPSVQWSAASQSVSEAAGTVTITARLSIASSSPVTVPVSVSGTATGGGVDFSFTTTSLTFPAGSTSQSVSMSIVNDTLYEGAESVILTMGTPNGANLGAVPAHTVTITDNETQPTVQVQAQAASVTESAGAAGFVVTLSGASANDVSVGYTVSGTAGAPADHGLTAGTVVITAGTTSKTVGFSLVNDTLYEGAETVVLALGSVSGATLGANSSAQITISDDEAQPLVQFAAVAQAAEESSGTAVLIVTMNRASAGPVSVPLLVSGSATANADYSVPNATVVIPAGSTQGSVTINVLNDTLHEGSETVTFTLGAPTGAALGTQKSLTLTIQDNDPVPLVQWTVANQSLNEDTGQARVDIRLSAASGLPTSVSYSIGGTAVSGTDFTAPTGSLTINAGSTGATISIPVINDTTPEPDDDTIILTLTAATGASLGSVQTHKITFTDNDSTGDAAIEGFRQSVYKFTRNNCVQCHGTTQVPLHAAYNIPTAYTAAKSKVNFNAIPESTLVIKSKDGHCKLANCMTDGSAMIAAIEAWKPFEPVVDPDPVVGSILTTGDTVLRLGTRKFVASKLINLFGAGEAATIVDAKVNSKPGIFGGSCDLLAGNMTDLPFNGYLGNCAERPDSHAPPIGIATSQRLALTIRSCDQIVQSDNAVNNAAKNALGVATSPAASRFPNDADIGALYRFYYRDRSPDQTVTDALRGVASAAQSQGYPSIDGWRFVILTLCKSPSWQIP